MPTLTTTRDDHLIAWLTALAITIHIAESALPSPLPGIKPGLANVIAIAVLMRYGLRMAAWVALLRVLVGSLLLGTFRSPTFILSLSGALASMALLAAGWVISSRLRWAALGPVGTAYSPQWPTWPASFGSPIPYSSPTPACCTSCQC